MKLCVLTKKIDEKYMYTEKGVYLYYLPIIEYKKQILKGVVCICEFSNARIYYLYSKDILTSRFEIGEEAISKSDWCSYLYANEVLKSRFILGEEVISFDGYYSYYYAVIVLKERFILGEQAIKKSGHRKEYEQYFNITL